MMINLCVENGRDDEFDVNALWHIKISVLHVCNAFKFVEN